LVTAANAVNTFQNTNVQVSGRKAAWVLNTIVYECAKIAKIVERKNLVPLSPYGRLFTR